MFVKKCCAAFIFLNCACFNSGWAGEGAMGIPSVPLYGVFEQAFNWASSGYENPWEQVQETVTFFSPSGRSITVGGFYYSEDTWKARFSPSETGDWTWKAVITDDKKTVDFKGSFKAVRSDLPGFVRPNPYNKFRWVFENGSPFYPIGIGDCINDVDRSGSPLDNWGFDGDFRAGDIDPAIKDIGWVTGIDTYLKAYKEAGLNLFRWSVDNCAFNLYRGIRTSGNVYSVKAGIWGDELVQKLRQYGFHIYMAIFGFKPPFQHSAKPEQMDAVKRYVKYAADRYGCYVDFWELMNEAGADDEWHNETGNYLKSIDPYRHPVSTSWQRPDLEVIDINSPHWYEKENEFESDKITWDRISHWKSHGKTVIVGEQGNKKQNWDERSGLRMRIRAWTAFFAEGVLIFWNSTFAKDYKNPDAANIYLGPEERGYLKILQDFTRGFDTRAVIAEIKISSPELARGYALSSPKTYAAYLHAYSDHANPGSGISITIEPQESGAAVWINPADGRVLGAQNVSKGTQTLAVPSFVIDIALKVSSGN